MLFVTGDVHGCNSLFSKFESDTFPFGKTLTKEDYIIVLGDFGCVWNYTGATAQENSALDWLNDQPWTTLFIDGNHENFDRLLGDEFPTKEWCGGQVKELRPSVLYLKRGYIFNIDGKSFLSMGGANSHDIQHGILDPADYDSTYELNTACRRIEQEHGGWRFAMYRIKGINWWPQEVPNEEERQLAIENLKKHNYKVDYVFSHEAPSSDVVLLGRGSYKPEEYSQWLEEEIRQKVEYKKWFFGHYHDDKMITAKEQVLYNNIVEVR